MDHVSLEKWIATEYIAFVLVFVVKLFTNSCSLGNLSISNLWQNKFFMSSCYCLHTPVFEILTWSSDRHAAPASPQASPCSADRTGFPSTIPQAAGMNTDEIRPLGSWLEDDEDTVLPVLLQSDSPHPLLFLLGSGSWEADLSKTNSAVQGDASRPVHPSPEECF